MKYSKTKIWALKGKNAKETDPFFEKRNPEKIRKKKRKFQKKFLNVKKWIAFFKNAKKKNGLRFLKTGLRF